MGIRRVFHFSNGFLGQKFLDIGLQHFHDGEPNRWAKVQAFIYAQLHVTASVFPYNKLGSLFGLVE
jgi:hypothetical protein